MSIAGRATPAPERFDPAGQAAAEAAFLDANPAFRETARRSTSCAPSEYGRLDASGDVYLDYTGGSLYAASQLEEHLRLLRETRLRQPALGQPDLVGGDRARRAGARRRAALLQRARERVRLHLHPERHGRAAARRRGLSVRAAATASWRRSTTTTRSTASASSPARRARGRRTCRSRRPTCAWPTGCSSATSTTPPRTATTSSPTRRSRTSPASSTRSSGSRAAQERGWDVIVDAAAFVPTSRLDLSVWKPDFVPISFYKMFGYPTGIGALLARRDGARAAAAPLVQRRHGGRRERPGRDGRAAVRPRAVRGRHGQLPRHPGDRDRPAPHRADRHRHDLAARRGARDVAARGAAAAAALGRQPGDPRLRADDVGPPRGARSRSTSCTRTAAWSTSASSTSSRRRTASPSAPGCFCNSGAGETAFSLSSDTLIGAEFADGMILDDYIRLDRHADGRRGARVARPRDELRRRPPLHALRDGVPRRHRGARRTCRRGWPARGSPPAGRAGAAPGAAPP